MVPVISLIIAICLVGASTIALAVGPMQNWFEFNIPEVPSSSYSDPETVVRELDLSQFGLELTELNPYGRSSVETFWSTPGKELRLMAYHGSDGRGFVSSSLDRVRTMSRTHSWGDQTMHQYQTRDHYKAVWHQGHWAFTVEVGRNDYSRAQFKELLEVISLQLGDMR